MAFVPRRRRVNLTKADKLRPMSIRVKSLLSIAAINLHSSAAKIAVPGGLSISALLRRVHLCKIPRFGSLARPAGRSICSYPVHPAHRCKISGG